MFDNITLGKYLLKDSVVHKLNPVFKILSLFIMIVSIFFINSYSDIIMLSMYLILVMSYTDISIRVYISNIYSIRLFLIFILVIDLIFYSGLNNIIFDLYKLIFVVICSNILMMTTPITEITYGIERIIKPLGKFMPISDISMVISLTLRYIPSLTIEANRIIKAQKLRGVNFNSKNIKERLSSIGGSLIPMFVLSINKAENIADIMDIRLYNYGKSRTNYRMNKWKKIDSLLLVLNIFILIIVIIY